MTTPQNLLAIDTSTPACSAALQCGTKRFARFDASVSKHTHVLLPMIEDLLQEAHLKPADLNGIIISIGPGAFTGLRVGASVALGLAYGASAKILPVSSLALLAQTAHRLTGQSHIISTLDARMGEIYAGAYHIGADETQALWADGLFTPHALSEKIATGEPSALMVGSGLVYPPFHPSALSEIVPQAIDAFDLLPQSALWQSPSVGVELNYLRNDVVDKPKP